MQSDDVILEALTAAPRWQVVHWGSPAASTLLCLWVAGNESLVSVDGSTASHAGQRRQITDGGLATWLREIQEEQDRVAVESPAAEYAVRWLLGQWPIDHEEAHGAWRFPNGGSLRWSRVEGLLHVEITENGDYLQPVPEPLRDVLLDLGWNPPDGGFRNCWLQPSDDELPAAATLAVLTTVAAFGYQEPPVLAAD